MWGWLRGSALPRFYMQRWNVLAPRGAAVSLEPSTKSKQLFILRTTWRQQQQQNYQSWVGKREKREFFSICILRASEKTETAQSCGCCRAQEPLAWAGRDLGNPPRPESWTLGRNHNIRLLSFPLGQNGQGWCGSCSPHGLEGSEVTPGHSCQPGANIKALFVPRCLLSAEFVVFAFLATSGMCLKEFFMLSGLIISQGQVAIEQGEIRIQGRGTTEHLSS